MIFLSYILIGSTGRLALGLATADGGVAHQRTVHAGVPSAVPDHHVQVFPQEASQVARRPVVAVIRYRRVADGRQCRRDRGRRRPGQQPGGNQATVSQGPGDKTRRPSVDRR